MDAAALQGNEAVNSPENQALVDQEKDLLEDENEMKAIADDIAKKLDMETPDGDAQTPGASITV